MNQNYVTLAIEFNVLTLWLCNVLFLRDLLRDFLVTECVCLEKWYQYIFSVSLEFGAYYITGQWGEFIIKMLLNAFRYFLGIFCCFYHKTCVFIILITFSDEVSNFRNRILTNQKHELESVIEFFSAGKIDEQGSHKQNTLQVFVFSCFLKVYGFAC